jgi:polyisoprenoid-binding protein YceI
MLTVEQSGNVKLGLLHMPLDATFDADVNKAIQGLDWLDSARFPQAVFHTSDIRRVGESSYVARGALTVKGVEQQIDVPFAWMNEADTATATGELTIKRAAFHARRDPGRDAQARA